MSRGRWRRGIWAKSKKWRLETDMKTKRKTERKTKTETEKEGQRDWERKQERGKGEAEEDGPSKKISV